MTDADEGDDEGQIREFLVCDVVLSQFGLICDPKASAGASGSVSAPSPHTWCFTSVPTSRDLLHLFLGGVLSIIVEPV